MIGAASDLSVRLARLIEEVSGNVVMPGSEAALVGLAAERAGELGYVDVEAYLRALEGGGLQEEWRDLLPRITVKESYLFRAPQQFAAIRDWLVPRLVAAHADRRRLSFWSAGCARGEEPATLAMVLADDDRLAGWEWRIVATDVDERALDRARSGELTERAVRQTPEPFLRRYLERRAGGFRLSPELAQRIDYRSLNLIREPFPFPPEPYDLVLLRNVLIYFRLDSQRRVVTQVARSLAPHGLLFLGPAETLWQISSELEPIDFGDCFGYAHPERAPAGSERATPESSPRKSASKPRSPVARLEVPLVAGAAGATNPVVGTRERVERAASRLAANDPEGCFRLLDEALRADPVDPGAHTLEGCAHALAGAGEHANVSFRAALFLDPDLYQARYWLAQSLLRQGGGERARRELRETLATLDGGRGRELRELAALSPPDPKAVRERCFAALREEG